MPPIERFGRCRLAAHQNRLLRHIKRICVPTLILIEFPQVPPREGGSPTVVKLIRGSSRVMKRLKRREREVFVQLNEGGAQLGIRQPNCDERVDLFVRGLQSA